MRTIDRSSAFKRDYKREAKGKHRATLDDALKTGRGAAVVKAVLDSMTEYGRAAAERAVDATENFVKQGVDIAWDALDELRGQTPRQGAAELEYILDMVLSGGGGPPIQMPA